MNRLMLVFTPESSQNPKPPPKNQSTLPDKKQYHRQKRQNKIPLKSQAEVLEGKKCLNPDSDNVFKE
jgi:hypothetical protein